MIIKPLNFRSKKKCAHILYFFKSFCIDKLFSYRPKNWLHPELVSKGQKKFAPKNPDEIRLVRKPHLQIKLHTPAYFQLNVIQVYPNDTALWTTRTC